jgi:hypothetical protein
MIGINNDNEPNKAFGVDASSFNTSLFNVVDN